MSWSSHGRPWQLARPPDEPRWPPRVTDFDRVVNALLLTDAGLDSRKGDDDGDIEAVEAAVRSWDDGQRAAAYEWAALSHIAAGDGNDEFEVPRCPPHVAALLPTYTPPAEEP